MWIVYPQTIYGTFFGLATEVHFIEMFLDAAFSLTVRSFLLGASLLTIGAVLLTIEAFLLTVGNPKVLEGHHPRGTTLPEALRGNLPLRALCGGLSEGSAGSF